MKTYTLDEKEAELIDKRRTDLAEFPAKMAIALALSQHAAAILGEGWVAEPLRGAGEPYAHVCFGPNPGPDKEDRRSYVIQNSRGEWDATLSVPGEPYSAHRFHGNGRGASPQAAWDAATARLIKTSDELLAARALYKV